MIKKIIFSLVLIVVAMTSAYFVHAQDVKHKTFATYDEIVAQKKPGIIYFYSETCTYCNDVFPIYKSLSKEFRNKFMFGVADVYDKNTQPLASKLRVRTIPAIYIYNSKNHKFTKIPVYMYHEDGLRQVFAKYSEG